MKHRKLLSLVLSAALTLGMAAPALAAGENIKPIEGENSTYIPTVEEAQAFVNTAGWMTGTDKGFEPQLTVNRATIYEMFWKMEGKPEAEDMGHLLGLSVAGEFPGEAWYASSRIEGVCHYIQLVS